MSSYLIDGHNLIAYTPGLSLSDPNDEAKLVERLKGYMARKGKRCTVIFDRGLPGGPSRDLSTYSVKVVFAHGGTSADAIILERIRDARDPASLIIVSADHEITSAASRRRISVILPADFAAAINTASVPDEDDPNPHISPDDVETWLRLFGEDPGDS